MKSYDALGLAPIVQFSLFALVLILRVGIAAPANAEFSFPFDPEKCETPTEKVIVRLVSGIALALPPDGLYISNPESDTPNATVPLGCPGNPIRTVSFKFGLGSGKFTNYPGRTHLWQFGAIGHDGVISSQNSRIKQLADQRDRNKNCGTTAEGIDFCYACKEDVERPGHCIDKDGVGNSSDGRPVELAAMYLVDRENITGPQSIPWSALCNKASSGGSRSCYVGYEVMDGLSISYRFGNGGLNIDKLRAIDLSLQEAMLEYRAPEYDSVDMR